MSELTLNGTTEIIGKEIPNIKGGFGPNEKAILAKDVAEFHDKEPRYVNKIIRNNVERFDEGVDYIDVKEHEKFAVQMVHSKILTQKSINASNNIYLLSERGYYTLARFFNDDWSWAIYKKLMNSYFKTGHLIDAEKVAGILTEFSQKLEQKMDDTLHTVKELVDNAIENQKQLKEINESNELNPYDKILIESDKPSPKKRLYNKVQEQYKEMKGYVLSTSAWDDFIKVYNDTFSANLGLQETNFSKKLGRFASIPETLEEHNNLYRGLMIADKMLGNISKRRKLTDSEIATIYLDTSRTHKELGEAFDVSDAHVSNIKNHKTRTEVTDKLHHIEI